MVSLPPSRRCCSSSRMSFPSDFVTWASLPLLAKSCHHPAWTQLHVKYPTNSKSAPWPPGTFRISPTLPTLTAVTRAVLPPWLLLLLIWIHMSQLSFSLPWPISLPLLSASCHLSRDMFSALGPLSSPSLSEVHHFDHGSRAVILLSSSRRVFMQTLKLKWTENSIFLALYTSCWITVVKNSTAESGLVHDHSCRPQLDFSCHPALHLVT